ncbi:helix-turn-helix domain-containing protein [Roseburia faecis]|uniref:helix-turn-helix domain-containing protein n=1 Tax=Roseburia faecis TaxID=301302 RepID=UPI003F9C6E05
MHINLNAMGTRMKRRRKELKMSQAELAEKVNVSNNHISSIETGKQIPSLTTFVKICEQLDTTPDFLLLGSLHTDNLPKNIYDSLTLCNKKDLPLIQDIVENFVSKRE